MSLIRLSYDESGFDGSCKSFVTIHVGGKMYAVKPTMIQACFVKVKLADPPVLLAAMDAAGPWTEYSSQLLKQEN